MTENVLLIEKNNGITTLTLNRPESKNALNRELSLAIYQAFEDLSDDRETKVVIVTGAGDAFCAGLDLKELAVKGLASSEPGAEKRGESTSSLMASFRAPIIGAVNGVAITGGFELALACDILIASTNAFFADTHARVGVIPGWGLSQKLPRIIGPGRAKELSFTGNYLSAAKAQEWGLVNRVVEPDELMPACINLAKDMLDCAPGMVEAYKKLIDEGYYSTLADGMEIERQAHNNQAPEVMASMIGRRRLGVVQRGRDQKKAVT